MTKFLKNLVEIFFELIKPRYWLLYIAAILLTYICVMSGLDWAYFLYVMEHAPKPLLFIADISGLFIPIFLPLVLFIVSKVRKNDFLKSLAIASASSIIIGFILSMIIKIFTGRISPPDDAIVFIDNSHQFLFGFMRTQILGGWPSSHITTALALATTISILNPHLTYVKIIAFGVALFIGIGVTFGFHWLSEFIAGSLFGIAIGHSVGTYFTNANIIKKSHV